LSTSDTDSLKTRARRTALTYLLTALFCGLFSTVYETFSHGVYSGWMICLALFPLLGGALPFGLLWRAGGRRMPEIKAARLYHCGLATLAAGSCVSGILAIYGTASDYVRVYWYAGAALIAAGLMAYLWTFRWDG
jgi:MFS family permease